MNNTNKDFKTLCAENNHRLTPQKCAIYKFILDRDDHPTAEMIYNGVLTNFPNISLATIYKNLKTLQQLGAINQIETAGTPRFDARLDTHHHLFLPDGRVVDVEISAEIPLPENVDPTKISKVSINYFLTN